MELIIGICIGACAFFIYQKIRLRSFHAVAADIITVAEKEAARITEKKELEQKLFERDWLHKKQQEMIQLEKMREERSRNEKIFDERASREKKVLENQKKELEKQSQAVRAEQEALLQSAAEQAKMLSKIAGYSQADARSSIEVKIRNELEAEYIAQLAKKIEQLEKETEQRGQQLICTVLQRAISKSIWTVTTTTLLLPNEEMKAKIIGKDGRNIRAFEGVTGVTLLIDEQPNSIVLSSFDPVRRLIAKQALGALMTDGRISPSRIEEVVKGAAKVVEEELLHNAQEAIVKTKVHNLHPDILQLLGKLSTRTSFGQNMLDHSIEVSTIMALLAQELKLDVERARRIGLLHDMGKALPPEAGLSHALAGYHMALRCGEAECVANGIGCHHDEMPPASPEGALCKFADAISASRPGARTESIEKHFIKLHDLEGIATSFEGVHTAYALDAGREIRVFVHPESVDDLQALSLARRIAKKIEERSILGRVQITVIREKRVVEYTSS